MRLQRIYSSKLYVTSTRKDKIHAAMQDPINAELVQQLEEYLDDDAQIELKQAIAEEKAKEQPAAQTEGGANGGGEETSPSSFTPSAPSHSSSPHSFTGDVMSDFGEDELADIDIPDDVGGEDSAPEPAEEPEPVESVTQEGRPITSSTAVIWTTIDDVASECGVIQGTLNAREDTKGVTRLAVKDSELWIYYDDDSNLNDKMVDVIEVLNSTGYTYLKFNRLARSNNAIVFDISLSTQEPIKTVKEVEEEKK